MSERDWWVEILRTLDPIVGYEKTSNYQPSKAQRERAIARLKIKNFQKRCVRPKKK